MKFIRSFPVVIVYEYSFPHVHFCGCLWFVLSYCWKKYSGQSKMGLRTAIDFNLTQCLPPMQFKWLIFLVSVTKWLPAACGRSQIFTSTTLLFSPGIDLLSTFSQLTLFVISWLNIHFYAFLWTLTNAFWKVSFPGTIDTCDFILALDPIAVIATISGNLTISPVQKRCRKCK